MFLLILFLAIIISKLNIPSYLKLSKNVETFSHIGPTGQKQINAPIITSGNPIQLEISKFLDTHIHVPNQIAKAKQLANKTRAGYKVDNSNE